MTEKKKAEAVTHDEIVAKSVRLSEPLNLQLAIFAAKTRRTHQDIIVCALEEYLEKYDV